MANSSIKLYHNFSLSQYSVFKPIFSFSEFLNEGDIDISILLGQFSIAKGIYPSWPLLQSASCGYTKEGTKNMHRFLNTLEFRSQCHLG